VIIMAFELIGLDSVLREEREEDLSGVGDWGDWGGLKKTPTSSPMEKELQVYKVAKQLNVKFASGKILPAGEFEKLVTQTGKELGSPERGKNFVLAALSRYAMGFTTSDGKTYWATSPQKNA